MGLEANVPKGSYLNNEFPGSSINTNIFARCNLPDVGPVPPGNITNVTSTIVGQPDESYGTGRRNVFAVINVTWLRPELQGSGINEYQFTVRREPLESNDTDVTDFRTVKDNVLSIEEQFAFLDVPLGTFPIFAQVIY